LTRTTGIEQLVEREPLTMRKLIEPFAEAVTVVAGKLVGDDLRVCCDLLNRSARFSNAQIRRCHA